jgi:hypothetical protein
MTKLFAKQKIIKKKIVPLKINQIYALFFHNHFKIIHVILKYTKKSKVNVKSANEK